jgi:hypothetical protein
MVYPNYIDATKTVAEGRMVSKAEGEWQERIIVSSVVERSPVSKLSPAPSLFKP